MKQIFSGQPCVLPRPLARRLTFALLFGALALVWTGGGCTAFYTKEPVVYRQNVAVYRVLAADYPGGNLGGALPAVQPFPGLDSKTLMSVLGNLEYRRESAWGQTHARVFYEEELRLIVPTLAEAIANADPAYRLVVVTRYDPDKSVLSRMERNTMVLWADENGLNVTFGEIREEIPNNDFRVDQNWTEVLPVSFERAYPTLELVPRDYFQLKQVRGYTHRTWAVMRFEDLADLKYQPLESERDVADKKKRPPADGASANGESSDTPAAGAADSKGEGETYFKDEARQKTGPEAEEGPTERLRRLKRALDEELITPEEYETQRQRILGEF